MWEEFDCKYGYQLLRPINEGDDQTKVFQVKKISDGKFYAVKLYSNCFTDVKSASLLYRELELNIELSQTKNNIFTPTIHDIIIPDLVIPDTSKIVKHNSPSPLETEGISSLGLVSCSKSLPLPKKNEANGKHGNEAMRRMLAL